MVVSLRNERQRDVRILTSRLNAAAGSAWRCPFTFLAEHFHAPNQWSSKLGLRELDEASLASR